MGIFIYVNVIYSPFGIILQFTGDPPGPIKARLFLEDNGVEDSVVNHIEDIIRNISFKGGNCKSTFTSKELKVVQDADRLDAIGAIGIARTFNYGGYKNRPLYDPNNKPSLNMSVEEYKNNNSSTINHFYEKLLLLKDLMNTKKGKLMAESRHKFMEQFLNEFYEEWEGKA